MLKRIVMSKRSAGIFVPVAIFAIALFLRLVFVFQWHNIPYGAVPLLDAAAYQNWAKGISHGQWLRETAFYQSPLFPYLLGIIYAATGPSLLVAGFLNATLGATTALIISKISERSFGFWAGIFAGTLFAFYDSSIFYTAPVMKETLGLCLLSLFLLNAQSALNEEKSTTQRFRHFAYCGATLGVAALVRGNVLLLAPIVPTIAFFQKKSPQPLKSTAIFFFAVLITIMPATLHNYLVSGDFVLINYADGFNFYIGHSPSANGTNNYPPEVSTDPIQEELNTKWIAEHNDGHVLRPSQISRYWRDRGIDFLDGNPQREVVLMKNKFLIFWNENSPFDNYDISFIRKTFPTILNAPLVPFWIIATWAAFGLATARVLRRGQLTLFVSCAAIYMVSVLIFYVTDRYRLPVIIFLLPVAAAGMASLSTIWRHKNWLVLSGGLIAAACIVDLALEKLEGPNDLTAFDLGTLTSIYTDMGRYGDAIETLHQGLEISPIKVGVQAYIRGAEAEEKLGSMMGAMHYVNTARALFPLDGVAWYNYGRMQAATGNLGAATESFQRAKALAPSYTLTYLGLAKIYEHDGKIENALDVVEEGLTADPGDQRLLEFDDELKQKRSWFFHPKTP